MSTISTEEYQSIFLELQISLEKQQMQQQHGELVLRVQQLEATIVAMQQEGLSTQGIHKEPKIGLLGVGKAACAEEITQQSVLWKNLRMGDVKQRNTHREREREREAQRGISLLTKYATATNEQQPLQKVTKSLYIVTHLGQLPFMLIT